MPSDLREAARLDAARRARSEVTGLDALELAEASTSSRGSRLWASAWPKLAAITLALLAWQLVAASGWRPSYVLPGPIPIAAELARAAGTATFWEAIGHTMRRALLGFAIATVLGLALGVAVARVRVLRAALGSMITGLQTTPSIAWFPLAILLFQLTESAILFVVVLGAAPSIANGVINGVDFVPPVLLRVGRNLGARGLVLYRYVVLPASLPSIVAGLKQGWAFAWRSLMAGELLVILANRPSIGVRLQFFRELSDAEGLIATMIVILVIGVLVDVAFTAATSAIRTRWGIADATG